MSKQRKESYSRLILFLSLFQFFFPSLFSGAQAYKIIKIRRTLRDKGKKDESSNYIHMHIYIYTDNIYIERKKKEEENKTERERV